MYATALSTTAMHPLLQNPQLGEIITLNDGDMAGGRSCGLIREVIVLRASRDLQLMTMTIARAVLKRSLITVRNRWVLVESGFLQNTKRMGSSSHDIKKSLPVLTEILSSSEHTFLAINWDFPGRISPEVSGGMLTAILHKYDEIAKFSNLGVTLLSRVEELLVRVSEVMKFYSILMHKKDSRQVIEKVMAMCSVRSFLKTLLFVVF